MRCTLRAQAARVRVGWRIERLLVWQPLSGSARWPHQYRTTQRLKRGRRTGARALSLGCTHSSSARTLLLRGCLEGCTWSQPVTRTGVHSVCRAGLHSSEQARTHGLVWCSLPCVCTMPVRAPLLRWCALEILSQGCGPSSSLRPTSAPAILNSPALV